MCYIDKKGEANCSERHATEHSLPKPIKEQGVENIIENVTGEIKNGRSIFNFSRPLDPEDDKYHFKIAKGAKINVLFSYRTKGNPDTEGGFLKHEKRTVVGIVLWPDGTSVSEEKNLEMILKDKNVKITQLKFNEYEIPAKETTYACRNFDITEMIQEITGKPKDTAYHAIAFQPIIDKEDFLHHLIVMSCDEDLNVSNEIFECPLSTTTNCNKVLFGWGLGSGNYVLPNNVGLLWGVAENKKITMQFHYNNPSLIKGVKDSTAINVYFTSNLRKYDSATMIQGVPTETITIPAQRKSFTISNTCESQCTETMKGAIYIFSVFLHGHTYLRKIRTEINFADGTIDDTSFRDDNFIFNNQKYVYLENPVKISPGDQMKTICEYDTTSTKQTVKGGESTSNEMCLAFLNYYQRENGLATCMSGIETKYGCLVYEKFKRMKDRKNKLKN